MRGRLAYTIIETARALDTAPFAVRKAIERGQIWAVKFGMAIQCPPRKSSACGQTSPTDSASE